MGHHRDFATAARSIDDISWHTESAGVTDQTFKNRDAESYNSVVAEFDRHTQAYSTYVIETLLQQVGSGPQTDFIDIGCGTGVVTFAFAERFGDTSKITGIDLSQGMLEFASREAKARGLDSCTSFLQCDAEKLTLADASIDVAVSLYAFRHFPNPDKAAREVFRVLRPGGRLIMAVGSGPALFSRGGVAAALAMLERRLLANCCTLRRSCCVRHSPVSAARVAVGTI